MRSGFLSLNWQDALKGLVVAFFTAIITGVYQVFQSGSAFDWPTLRPVLFGAIAAALGYLIKNYLTNSDGKMFKLEVKR